MKQVTLNGKKMTDRNSAHVYIASKLGFPEYYGKNLDALFDCVSEFCLDKYIRFSHFDEAKKNLGDYADKLCTVFFDIADTNPRIKFKVLPYSEA